MYCNKCGAENPDNSKFCSSCGEPFEAAQETPVYDAEVVDDGYSGNSRSGSYNASYGSGSASYSGQNTGADQPEHGAAVGSLVCGIISIVCWFFGWSSLISVVLGIIGIILANNAKKAGNTEGIRTAGFVTSVIGLIGGALVFVVVVLIIGLLLAIGGAALL